MRVLSRFFSNGSTSYKTTPETLARWRSLETRPRQEYTHRVMVNDCVIARWSPMYQYLALTLLRDSHSLPTRHIREPIGGFSSHFCISVSVLRFPFQRFPLAPTKQLILAFSRLQYGGATLTLRSHNTTHITKSYALPTMIWAISTETNPLLMRSHHNSMILRHPM